MRALAWCHRWIGVATCLLVAIWFASGIVMHFVPFPRLEEAERSAGLAELAGPVSSPYQVLQSSRIEDGVRMRLAMVAGRPVYVVTRLGGESVGFDALSGIRVRVTRDDALASVKAYVLARGIAPGPIEAHAPASHEQWTVPNGYDPHRPLHRVALNDAAGTELHVSSATGEVVLDTTRAERRWNALGSVAHWLYPTALRRNWAIWDTVVWWTALVALAGAACGSVLGLRRLRAGRSPYRGWLRWHHLGGLACAGLLLSWLLSGWLSMDHGRLFSSGQPTRAELHRFHGSLEPPAAVQLEAGLLEIEWFALGGTTLIRRLHAPGDARIDDLGHVGHALRLGRIDTAARAMDPTCAAASPVPADDWQRGTHASPTTPLVRVRCTDRWLHIDAATGRLIEILDASRRAYQWLYLTLHTWDVPPLRQRPTLRSALVVILCTLGFAFSITGLVLGWQRLAGRWPR